VPLTPEGETKKFPDSYGGFPSNFIVTDSTIQIMPVTASPIQLMYWMKIPYLTEENPTNWLLLENPGMILTGAMKYLEAYKRNMTGVQLFGGLYTGLVDGAVRDAKRAQWSRTRARVSGRSTP